MKRFFKGFLMSLSMFSVFPVPRVEKFWDDTAMPLVIPFFPLIGALVGGVWFFSASLAARFFSNGESMVAACLCMLAPFIVSGFIHTDGFTDTADAVFSRRGREEKIKILKDPNVGAFGAVSLCVLFLASFCAVRDVLQSAVSPIFLIYLPVVSRCAAGGALLMFKPFSETGFAASFKRGVGKAGGFWTAFLFSACLIAVVFLNGLPYAAPLLAAGLTGLITAGLLVKSFGGISGDLCGAAVTVTELAGLLFYALTINLFV